MKEEVFLPVCQQRLRPGLRPCASLRRLTFLSFLDLDAFCLVCMSPSSWPSSGLSIAWEVTTWGQNSPTPQIIQWEPLLGQAFQKQNLR